MVCPELSIETSQRDRSERRSHRSGRDVFHIGRADRGRDGRCAIGPCCLGRGIRPFTTVGSRDGGSKGDHGMPMGHHDVPARTYPDVRPVHGVTGRRQQAGNGGYGDRDRSQHQAGRRYIVLRPSDDGRAPSLHVLTLRVLASRHTLRVRAGHYEVSIPTYDPSVWTYHESFSSSSVMVPPRIVWRRADEAFEGLHGGRSRAWTDSRRP